jgi:hypothetical protein
MVAIGITGTGTVESVTKSAPRQKRNLTPASRLTLLGWNFLFAAAWITN